MIKVMNDINKKIKLSICIPTYNRAEKLSKAIDSVLIQKDKNYELIICDNASTDNTRDIVNSYQDSRIKYFFYEDLVSMYANHNRCLKHCLGEWILFLHSDDLLTNLENVIEVIDNLPTSASCCFTKSSEDYLVYRNWNFIDILQFLNGHSPSGSVYRLDALLEIGGFKEDNIIADWEVLLDFISANKIVTSYNSNKISLVERINHDQNSYLKSIKDGTAHQGKTFCIKRSFTKLKEQNKVKVLLEEIAQSWKQSQIMKLNFYLNLSGFFEESQELARMANSRGNYSYWHPQHFYSLLAKYLQLDNFIRLYQKFRFIY